ncbi:mucin-2-like [Puntigrus tetrazona]|uniref:mucin-2-like n=1 Tax=Puntigrus tetrazona TaxID=1606681 RepID=UPI001C890D6E|nr:mucin-2-like [Puntigrus tetrazona]
MGTVKMSQMWMLRWVVLMARIQAGFMEDFGVMGDSTDLTMWPTTATSGYSFSVRASNHVSNICSMWGNFHFKTFDGVFYQFPGTCEYNLVSDCQSLIRQFSVYVKRTENTSSPKITRVLVTVNDITVEITANQVIVNGKNKSLPVLVAGILVEENTIYMRLRSKMGITVMWNKDDAVMVELDSKYLNQTCGLCGDFNGAPVYNEFIQSEFGYKRHLGYIEFGNKHKVLNPVVDCKNPSEEDDEQNLLDLSTINWADYEDVIIYEDWSSCIEILNPEPYIKACMNDMYSNQPEDTDNSTLCATLSEYSRQCSHAGGTPPTWRKADFCAVKCPYNMVHSESGSPCMDTCSHKDTNALCEEHNMDGCFCPPGTVFDEISNMGCVMVEECQCKHDNIIYSSGEVLQKHNGECICKEGTWICTSIPGPGLCSVEEGSHFTTFDGKEFTFHGDCNYVLSQDFAESKFIILGQIVPCANLNTDTCLKSIEVMFNNDKNHRLVIKADGTVQHNAIVPLPYMTADFTVFMPSSFYIMVQTTFGLQVQVQLVPLMQVYITVGQSFQDKTCGLCGNFNKVLSDDLKTPQGLVEGTAVSFANAWKAQSNCPDRTERLDDPCSYSSDSKNFAEHWCSQMKKKKSLFAQCHARVNPDSYYKRCKYSSCTCEKSEDCLCAVFSSYARACAAKGIILQGWREIVCEKYTENCPASQNYSYELQSCQRTCLSLASERQSCSLNFVPVDGCTCPEGLYQDENGLCVPMEKCPCYHNGGTVQPGSSVNIKNTGEHCVCVNGTFRCLSWKPPVVECTPPKMFFNCSTARPNEHGLMCAQTCMQKETDCFSQDCESGCQCPAGLLDDGRGNCVRPHDCPCPHNGQFYAPGTEITVDCNKCTCQHGTWTCTNNICPGVCTIYGSGHYKTFDQQRFGFRGECSYIAAQDKCGNKTGFFHVITENIPCGTTGTTCSKAVVILLGRTKLQLYGGTVTAVDTESGPQINYNMANIGMYLVIDADIGLTILWDRKTTVRIILQPQHMRGVCGLCGNFNGNGKDDFTTQGSLQTTDIMEFVDSWKVLGACPDPAPDFDPCLKNLEREPWAKLQCSIVKDREGAFKHCHNKVDPSPYYENCVKDSCACDTGGDCECFCTAVAAYAQACIKAGVCVNWRTPEICPVYCDYYNKPEICTWHYNPCGVPCYKTCRNPLGICNNTLPSLEGCYPECPNDKPIFDEQNQVCVKECIATCYVNGTEYKPGENVPTDKSCHECICKEHGNIKCSQNPGCCNYGGKQYGHNDIIYNIKDNMEMCYYAVCINATVIASQKPCTKTTSTTPSIFTTTFTTTPIPPVSTETPPVTSTRTSTTTSTFTTSSTTTTTPMPPDSTETPPGISTSTTSTSSTFTTSSTTTTTPMPPDSTETPPETSTSIITPSTFTSTSTTTTTPMPPESTETLPVTSTSTSTTPSTFTTSSTTTTTPMPPESTETPPGISTSTTSTSSTFTTSSTDTTTPMPPESTETPPVTSTSTSTTPSTFTTSSTTTTSPMPPESTETPPGISTSTTSTPSTFTISSTTTTTPMPPDSTETPRETSTSITTPSTFTTPSTTTTTPMPPESTETPPVISTSTTSTPSTFTSTSTTTTTPMPLVSTETPPVISTSTTSTPSTFTTSSTTTTTSMPPDSTETPPETSTSTSTTPSTFSSTSTTTTTPMPPESTETPPVTSTSTTTTPTTFISTSTTTTIPMPPESTETPPEISTSTSTTPSTFTTSSTTKTTPMPPESTEKPPVASTSITTPSTFSSTSTTTTTPMSPESTETPPVISTSTTSTPSTFTISSTTTTTPMPPDSTETPPDTSTSTSTTPSTFTTSSTTTTTSMPPESTETPPVTSTSTTTTPTTFISTSTTTTIPMPPESTETPPEISTSTSTTPSTFTTSSTTKTTPMPPESTETPPVTSTSITTPSTFSSTSTTTTIPMPPESTETPPEISTSTRTTPSTFTTSSTTKTTPMPPESTETPPVTSTSITTPSTFSSTSTTTTTSMLPESTETPPVTSRSTTTTPTTFISTSTTTTIPMPPESTETPPEISTSTSTTPSTFTTSSTTTTTPMPPDLTETPPETSTSTSTPSTFTTSSTTTTTSMPPESTETPPVTSTSTTTTPTTFISTSTTTTITMPPESTETPPEISTSTSTTPSTFTTSSTTTTTPMPPESTETPPVISTSTTSTPSTFTISSTTTTIPMPPESTETPPVTSTSITTPSTFSSTSTTTTTPMSPESTETPPVISTSTTSTPSTFTISSTTTTTPMPPDSTETPPDTSTSTSTTPSTFTTSSTTTTTSMPPESTETPPVTSTSTTTTPTTFISTSTTTTIPMPPESTETPPEISTSTSTTPSTFTTSSTTKTTPMPPESTETPPVTSTSITTPSTFSSTSTTTTTPMPPESTETPPVTSTSTTTTPTTFISTSTTTTIPMPPESTETPPEISTSTRTTPSTFTTSSTTKTTPMPPESTETPPVTSTSITTPSTFSSTSTTTTTSMPPESTETPPVTSTSTTTTPTTFISTSTTTTIPMPPESTETPPEISTSTSTTPSTFTTSSTTTTTPMPPESTETPPVISTSTTSTPSTFTISSTTTTIPITPSQQKRHLTSTTTATPMPPESTETPPVISTSTTSTPSTFTISSATTTTPMPPDSTEMPPETRTSITTPSTFSSTSTTTTTPMPPESTETPPGISTSTTSTSSTFTTSSTTTTTPMPPDSTETPPETSTSTSTTPSTFTTSSTTTTIPMPPESTETPPEISTSTSTTPSTFTTSSTTKTTPMPPESTEKPPVTSTSITTPSTFSSTSTTTTTPMPPESTETPPVISTSTTSTPSTFTISSTTTTTPMPPDSTETPPETSTSTSTTPSTFTTSSTTTTTSMPPESTETPPVTSTSTTTTPTTFTSTSTTTTIPMPPESTETPPEISTSTRTTPSTFTTSSTTKTTPMPPESTETPPVTSTSITTPSTFSSTSTTTTTSMPPESTETPPVTSTSTTTTPTTFIRTSTTTTIPMPPESTETPPEISTSTSSTPSTFTTSSTTTTTPMPPDSTETPPETSTSTSTPLTFTTSSTTTTTSMPPESTETPPVTSTSTTTTPTTFISTSTTTTIPMPPESTETPPEISTSTSTTPSTFTTSSTTTTTPMPPESTETPPVISTSTTSTPSTFTISSTTTTIPMPPDSTEMPPETRTSITTPSTFSSTSTTTTTPMPPESTETPPGISTSTTSTSSTFTTSSTTTTTPMPPESTETPPVTSTSATATPSTFTISFTTTTTPIPPSTEMPPLISTSTSTAPLSSTTSSTTKTFPPSKYATLPTPFGPTISTPLCFCLVQGRQYKPGESIFDHKHIGSGICLTMICSISCEIQNSTQQCPSPISPTPAPQYDCPEWNKNTNETFSISDCSMAKCIKGSVIEIVPLQCPLLQNITCENHQPAVVVYDKSQCCQQYACDCFCEGWGNSHYMTFDGLFYSYQGNCTYILMEEIRPRYHLKIYIDNIDCDISEHASCPRSVTVSYNDQVVTLRNQAGGANLEALKDNVKLTLPYAHNGVKVISSGLDNLFLSIPELNVDLTFRGLGFSINLPFQHFGNNTQGHCGTCNNNQADDCMIPGGILVNDCKVMADYWQVNAMNGKNCHPVPDISPPKPDTQCLAQSDCNLLESKLFKACHSHVPPKNFFLACQLDSCNMNNPTMACASLQSYARACSQVGVCIHWRNYTKHCNIKCPEDKIFSPCGPSEPPTCRDGPIQNTKTMPTEGCFCPENTILFNTESGLCVPKCGCLDPSGRPREYDERFRYNCEDCVCDRASQSVICKPKKCPDVNPEICTKPGFVLVNVTDPSDPCCRKQVCHCAIDMCQSGLCIQESCIYNAPDNTRHIVKSGEEYNYKCETVICRQLKDSYVIEKSITKCPVMDCAPGFKYQKNVEDCCGTCTQFACVYDAPDKTRHILKDGEVDNYHCETVTCHAFNGSFVTEKTKTECSYLSSFDCGPGFEYIKKEGECCGSCRQVACIYDAPDKTRHILKDGMERNFKCMNATCMRKNGMFMTMESFKQCPPFNPDDCVPETVQFDKDGCCQICETRNCILRKNFKILRVKDCSSISEVEIAFCTGHCDDESRYSMEKNNMAQSCSCCQGNNFITKEVMLKCVNGTMIPHNYNYVESCICTSAMCKNYAEEKSPVQLQTFNERLGENKRNIEKHEEYHPYGQFKGRH